MAYHAPPIDGTPPPIEQGTGDTGQTGVSPVGGPAAGFAGVGLMTPSGVSPLTAALLPSDQALTMMSRWLLAWAVFFLCLFALDRTRLGHAALYYALCLAVAFTAVTEWRWFANVLAPLAGRDHGTASEDTGGGGGEDKAPVPAELRGASDGASGTTGTGGGPDLASSPADQLGNSDLDERASLSELTVQPF